MVTGLLIYYSFSFLSLQLCKRPSEMQRPLFNMIPASVTTHTKPLSGTVCEDILNLTEVFGLLTLLPGFEEHERELLQAAEGSSSSPDTLHETTNNLQVIRHIWLRICSAAIFSLRCWSMKKLRCTKDAADEDPGNLDDVNRRIAASRYEYEADCTMFLALFEVYFPRTSLSTNAHSAACRAKYEMEMMGALLLELGIERTVSYHSLIFNIMYMITSYNAYAIPFMRIGGYIIVYLLLMPCIHSYRRLGSRRKVKGGASRLCKLW